MLGRGLLEQPIEDGDAVEARRSTISGRSWPGTAPLSSIALAHSSTWPLDAEDLEVHLGAPGEELAHVGGIARPRRPGIPGEEAGDGKAGFVVEDRRGADDCGRGHGRTSFV
jgi:hypothetical protein